MTSVSETSELLKELRIDRDARRVHSWSRPRVGGVILLGLLSAAGLWIAFAQPTPPAVRTALARASNDRLAAASVLDASGYVTARRQATVSAKITGKVTDVPIEEGMRVEEGAVLARLDDTEARARLMLARAQLAHARSASGEIRAQLEQAERDYARQRALFADHLVSAQSLDAAVAQRDVLRARIANAEEQIHVAEESAAVAGVQLDDTIVRAPFSGIVVAKAAQPGEMISPISAGGGFTRTGIGTIVDMDSLEIEVDVNEAYINLVTPGQSVEATLNAYADRKIPGAVIALIPTADRAKATVKVRIAIKEKDQRIVPDMSVRVAFLGAPPPAGAGAPPAGVLVPAEAVRAEGESQVVFVVAEDHVERRVVALGTAAGGQHRVLRGVAGGERVVLSPPASLADGDVVRLAENG